MDRLARDIAFARGVPLEAAMDMVRTVFDAIRTDLATAQRFVMPGVLVIDRKPEGSQRPFSTRLVLRSRALAALRIARYRAKRRGG